MGELIDLEAWRAQRPGAGEPAVFHFDLACPYSQIAAEFVDRLCGRAIWAPTRDAGESSASTWDGWRFAEADAAKLGLPFVRPEGFPDAVPAAMRAAVYAAHRQRGARFALAAGRLAFCGGYRLDDPEVLAEAAAAAGVDLAGCLAAAGDPANDVLLANAALALRLAGGASVPALRLGSRVITGARAIEAELKRSHAADRSAPVHA